MKERLLEILSCPRCGAKLDLQEAEYDSEEIKEGKLNCAEGCSSFDVTNYIPRLVDSDNYARGFGFQWHRHAQTQVDKFNGTRISHDRFYRDTKWPKGQLSGQSVLELGCGSGRFTEIMLEEGMEVFSIDYSNAVDACLANHGLRDNFHLIQGNVYELPFAADSFDKVFCLGVLQHTPDVAKSFACLAECVKSGGEMAVDVYPNHLTARMHYPRYVLRPLTKRLPPKLLYGMVQIAVPLLLPISIALKSIPLVGRYLYPLLPVANYWRDLPLTGKMLFEWSVIDTFDWLGSWFDQPQSAETLKTWFSEAGFVEIEIERSGSIVGRGIKS